MSQLGVLWDMDGVLVDTTEWHYRAWDKIFSEYGVPFDRETFRSIFGMDNTHALEVMLGEGATEERIEEIAERKERLFLELIRGRVEVLPGVRAWLRRLKGQGVPQAVASSAPKANVEQILDELDLHTFFEAVVCSVDAPGKPHPGIFLEAAERIGVPPARCVVIEDAVSGVEAAGRAGMACVAVTTTSPASALSGADVIVNRLDELSDDVFRRLVERRARA